MRANRIAIAIVCSLSLGLLSVGCGGDGDGANKDTVKKEAPKAEPAKPVAEKVTAPDKVAPAMPTLLKVKSALPKQSDVDVRWAINLRDRKIVKLWLPPERLTPSISLDVDYLLALTDRNDLIAFRRRSGEAVWWTRLSGPLTGDPSFSQFGLYLIVRSHIICLEVYSGEVVWRINLPFAPSSGPAVSELNKGKPVLYVPGLDRRVYALEVEKETWPPKHGAGSVTRADFVMDKYILNILWRYATYSQVAGNIVYYDRQVFATDAKYNVYAIQSTELSIGKPKNVRLYRTQGPMRVGPTVVGRYLYVPCRDRNLYCLRRRDVSEEWHYASGHLLETPAYAVVDPFVNRTAIICRSGVSGPLVGLLDTTGKPLWELKDGADVIALFADPENELDKRAIMVVYNRDQTLSGHFASTGKEIWRIPGTVFGPYCVNGREPLAYTAAYEGRILCALQKGK